MPVRYTNGLNLETLLPILTARKGWKQPTVSTFTPVLSTSVKECTSGMYYNFAHSSCSPVNIYSCQEDNTITDANFNQYLLDLKQQVAVESVLAVFRENSPIEPPKIIFEKAIRSEFKLIDNSDKFNGWQICVAEGDFATQVESITLMFDRPCTVTIYCYNEMKLNPLWDETFTVTAGYDQQVFNVTDLILSRLNDVNKGGIFYIGYFQAEVEAQGAKAVDVFLNWWGKFNMIGFQGFQAVSDYDSLTFDKNRYFGNYSTYGLNLELTTYRDQTNTVVRAASAFDKLQDYMMIVKCLELQMNSLRSNGDRREVRDNYEMLYNEIEGLKGGEGIPYRQGVKDRITREVKRLQQTFFPEVGVIHSIPPVPDYNYDSYNRLMK